MKLYKIVSCLVVYSFIILGFLTIGSIINGIIGYYINLIIGAFFIVIGCYLYLKSKSVLELLSNIKQLNEGEQVIINLVTRFLFFEKVFIILSFLLGIILLSGAISRVFGEGLPIFG